jgi:hypothetical protein
MSEQDNVEVVRDLYASFGKADIPAILGALTAETRMHHSGSPDTVPWGSRTYTGPEEWGKFFSELNEALEPDPSRPSTASQKVTEWSPSGTTASGRERPARASSRTGPWPGPSKMASLSTSGCSRTRKHTLGFETLTGPTRPAGTMQFSSEGEATRVDFEMELNPCGFMRLKAPLIERQVQHSNDDYLERFKQILEGQR